MSLMSTMIGVAARVPLPAFRSWLAPEGELFLHILSHRSGLKPSDRARVIQSRFRLV